MSVRELHLDKERRQEIGCFQAKCPETMPDFKYVSAQFLELSSLFYLKNFIKE